MGGVWGICCLSKLFLAGVVGVYTTRKVVIIIGVSPARERWSIRVRRRLWNDVSGKVWSTGTLWIHRALRNIAILLLVLLMWVGLIRLLVWGSCGNVRGFPGMQAMWRGGYVVFPTTVCWSRRLNFNVWLMKFDV